MSSLCSPGLLAAVKLDDPGHVRAGSRSGEDLSRGELDLLTDLVILQPLVAFKHDAVDDVVFTNGDGNRAIVVPYRHIGEQFGPVKLLQRLVQYRPVITIADLQRHIGTPIGRAHV